jgi:hypothetical protein
VSVTLLVGELDILAYHYRDANLNSEVSFMITTFAVRISYSRRIPHFHNATIPVSTIIDIEKTGGKKRGGWYGITLTLATTAKIRIGFSKRDKEGRPKFFNALQRAIGSPFSFQRVRWVRPADWLTRLSESSGWTVFVNDICSTYAPRFLVPPGLSWEVIKQCGNYRSRNRLPILSYVAPGTGAPLLRSSQPRTGISHSACEAEREFMRAARGGRPLAILDCRPKLNAVVNQFTGGGYESVEDHVNSSFVFLGIPNIHRVRACYLAMVDGFYRQRSQGWRDWAVLTRQLVDAASLGVRKLQANEAVLVHCTDGWDRTAQIASLIQIMMDPFSRTMEGFKQLIDKEWCDAGYLFALRHGQKPVKNITQSSPVFAQFLDAVWQLKASSPEEFEFNEAFLAFLAFHSYSQLYGDFLGNCFRDRAEMERPPCIWACFDEPNFRVYFVNPGFAPSEGELSCEGGMYELSPEICGNPLFGCNSTLPLKVDEPVMDPAWLVVDATEIRIPQNDEPLDIGDPQDKTGELDDTEPIMVMGSPIAPSILDPLG